LKLRINNFFVANRIYRTVDVHYITVVKTPQNMDDGTGSADITQKLISKAFTFAGTLYQAGNVNNLNRVGNNTLRFYQFTKFVKALIRNGDHSNIGFNCAKWKVSCLCFCV